MAHDMDDSDESVVDATAFLDKFFKKDRKEPGSRTRAQRSRSRNTHSSPLFITAEASPAPEPLVQSSISTLIKRKASNSTLQRGQMYIKIPSPPVDRDEYVFLENWDSIKKVLREIDGKNGLLYEVRHGDNHSETVSKRLQ